MYELSDGREKASIYFKWFHQMFLFCTLKVRIRSVPIFFLKKAFSFFSR